jgi:hypothetical protein
MGTGKAKESIARLPRQVTNAFAVFRLARRREDPLPKYALPDVGFDLRLVFGSYVRRIGQIASGAAYFVVPGRAAVSLSRRCLQRLSPGRQTRQHGLAVAASKVLLLCLDDFENGGGDYCYSAHDALAGRAFASADGPEPPPGTPDNPSTIPVSVSVLAPDGAATVEAIYPGEAPIDAPITNNFATFIHTIQLAPHATRFPNFNPSRATFKRADGSVLVVSHPPVDAPRFGDH